MSKMVFAGVLLSLLCLPTSGAAQTDAPEGLVNGFVKAWNAHDMKAFGNLFAEDADFVNVAATWWKGRAEIQAKHEESHATRFKPSTLVATETAVRMARPDVAVMHVRWQLTGAVDREGKPDPPRQGVLQVVAARQPDGWRIIAAQNTNQAPPR